MRIIAGRMKGLHLEAPRWPGLRPTSDKLRETLFNVLGARVADARVLDGCAGTGAVGLEAISRGAALVTFVEIDRRARTLIEANAARCGVKGGYTIECRDLVSVLRQGAGGTYDLILLDPPYDAPNGREMLEEAARRLAPGGLVVLERASRRPPDVPPSLERLRDVRSGDSTLTFFARVTGATDPRRGGARARGRPSERQ
jgi:16S rRNA (guanine(966)-N(2))-methyltransferase RsmD